MENPTASPTELEFVIEDNGGDLIMFCSWITDPEYDQHLNVPEFNKLGWLMAGELMWEKVLTPNQIVSEEISKERTQIEMLGSFWNPNVSHF